MGDLTFDRIYYINKHNHKKVFLFDEILDLILIGITSQNLIEKTTLTKVSHQTIKNKVESEKTLYTCEDFSNCEYKSKCIREHNYSYISEIYLINFFSW